MDGLTTIKTHPSNSTSILVRGIPRMTSLAADDEEDNIKIPPEFHDLLVWGPLVYMHIDERDKGVGGEVNVAQGKWDLGLEDYKTWLISMQVTDELETSVNPLG